jgi:hypothetical protein
MNPLQSLPVWSLNDAAATASASRACRLGITGAARGMAARSLTALVRQRRVSPDAVSRAVALGDEAVSNLLRAAARLPMLPEVIDESLSVVPDCGAISPTTLDELLAIAARFVLDGDVDENDLIAVGEGRSKHLRLVSLVQRGWDARCARLDPTPDRHSDARLHVCYSIMLVTVEEALSQLSGGENRPATEYLDGALEGGVLCSLISEPFARLPSNPFTDPDFYAALREVWSALAGAASFYFLVPFDPSMQEVIGFAGECMADAILTASWTSGGEPVFTPDALEDLREQAGIGEDPSDMSDMDGLIAHAKWMRAAAAIPAMTPSSPQFSVWLGTKATVAQCGLITRLLHHLNTLKAHGKQIRRKRFECQWGGDGCFAACLLPTESGIHEIASNYLDSMYDSGETPVLQIAPPETTNVAAWFRILDHVVVEATIATACLNEIINYEDR